MTEQDKIELTHEELRRIVQETVAETLLSLGADVKNPLTMQKDFQHLRDWREATETMQRKGLVAIVLLIVSGLAGLVWLGFTSTIGSP